MNILDNDIIDSINYSEGVFNIVLRPSEEIENISTALGRHVVNNGSVSISPSTGPILLDNAEVVFKSGKRYTIDTIGLPQLFGRFPDKNLPDDIRMFIVRQNAQYIKQPYLRIANSIGYAYRALEINSKIDIDIAYDINSYLLNLTYGLKQSDNCKNDKFHLRMSILYVLMQLEIARENESGFISVSEEFLSLILKLRFEYNFKDSFYNAVRGLLLMYAYSKKSGDKNAKSIFDLVLYLLKSSMMGYDINRVEKTYLEMADSVFVVSLFKKGEYIDDITQLVEEGIRLNKNKEYISRIFNKFGFDKAIVGLGDLDLV